MCEKKSSPSMDAWLKEAKAHESAEKIGMYLTHNGVVRKSAKAKVRLGETDTKDVTINTPKVVIIILPSLLGLLILDIDVVIVRNIRGTIITKSKLIKISPSGLTNSPTSLNNSPTITPIITAKTNIKVDL